MKVLSLGWGVQSFTLAAMCALGEFEKPDVAIHADTLHERSQTYIFAKRMTPWLEAHGVKVVTVKNPTGGFNKIAESQVFIPAYTLSERGDEGKLMRTCTQRWKIAPVRSWLQEHRNGERVEQWMGISTDEAYRMTESKVKYIINAYPLIDLGMSRNDCKAWLAAHDIETPPRSSCTFCPFHSSAEWHDVKNVQADWEEAIEIENRISKRRPNYTLYLHKELKPLDQIDFRTEQEKGQLTLWDEECEGLCGV